MGKLFEAARKQGATVAHDDESASSSRTKKDKPFTGVGYSLGNTYFSKIINFIFIF